VAGIIFVVGCSVAGWLIGTVIDSITEHRKVAHERAKIHAK